jgi:adenine phosphoribosyltransferase
MAAELTLETLKQLVRDVPDFPRRGIVFKDICPVLSQPGALDLLCDEMARPFMGMGVRKVFAIESRGFFFGTGIARRLEAGLVPVRKEGKLPWECFTEKYELEYGEASLQIHRDAARQGEKVLLVDDVLATGGTLRATHSLASKVGAEVIGAACFIELSFLKGRSALAPLRIETLWRI